MDLIQNELLHAGESTPVTPLLLRLDEHRITTDSNLDDEDFLFTMKGMPCFPRKDLTAITGQAKTGKTVLISMLLSCGAMADNEQSIIDIKRNSKEPLRVMWVDTEQSPRSTQNILNKRIKKMVLTKPSDDTENQSEEEVFPEDLFYVFNIRKAEIDERIELLAEGIDSYHPDLVVVDNVRDLTRDINDGPAAQKLIERLMDMATTYDCNITCVIHQNRNAENRGLRGWLGTELMNKVFEVFACQKTRQKEDVKPTFSVEQSLTRKYDIDSPMYYQMNDKGLPVTCEAPAVQPRNANGQFASYGKADTDTLNDAYIIRYPDNPSQPWEWDLRKLFSAVFGSRASISYNDLREAVMKEAHIQQKKYYEKVFSLAEDARVVYKDKDRCGRIVVQLIPA